MVCSTSLAPASFRSFSETWSAARAVIQVMATNAVANSTEVVASSLPWMAALKFIGSLGMWLNTSQNNELQKESEFSINLFMFDDVGNCWNDV